MCKKVLSASTPNGKCTLKKKDETNRMKVRNYTGHKVTIKQLGPHDARETLGVMQAPDGNEDVQVTKLKK